MQLLEGDRLLQIQGKSSLLIHFLSLLPLSISFFATCLFATCHLSVLRHVLFTLSHTSPPTKVSSLNTKKKTSKLPNQTKNSKTTTQSIKQTILINQSTRPSDKKDNISPGEIEAVLQVEVNFVGDKTGNTDVVIGWLGYLTRQYCCNHTNVKLLSRQSKSRFLNGGIASVVQYNKKSLSEQL